VEERPASRALSDAIWNSLEVDRLDLDRLDVAAEVARCEIDHSVPPVPFVSGLDGARARLKAFMQGRVEGLRRAPERAE